MSRIIDPLIVVKMQLRLLSYRVFARVALLFVLFSAIAPIHAQSSNGVMREAWLNIGGTIVSDLTNNPAFPNNPSLKDILTNGFETPTDIYDNYGQRVRALLVPPVTGSYFFFIATDDGGQLFLSTNASPAGKARSLGWTAGRHREPISNRPIKNPQPSPW